MTIEEVFRKHATLDDCDNLTMDESEFRAAVDEILEGERKKIIDALNRLPNSAPISDAIATINHIDFEMLPNTGCANPVLADQRDSHQRCPRCGFPNDLSRGTCSECGREFEDQRDSQPIGSCAVCGFALYRKDGRIVSNTPYGYKRTCDPKYGDRLHELADTQRESEG